MEPSFFPPWKNFIFALTIHCCVGCTQIPYASCLPLSLFPSTAYFIFYYYFVRGICLTSPVFLVWIKIRAARLLLYEFTIAPIVFRCSTFVFVIKCSFLVSGMVLLDKACPALQLKSEGVYFANF
jgi:hypothetical protein